MNVFVWVIRIYHYDGKETRGYKNTSKSTDMPYGENNWSNNCMVYLHCNMSYKAWYTTPLYAIT